MLASNVCWRIASDSPRAGADRQSCSIRLHGSHYWRERRWQRCRLERDSRSVEAERSGRFLAVNCAAIPGDLIESELFGHERGAFTSASARRLGIFEQANGGTVFLDEIAEMKPELQPKLLRVLEDQKIRRVGAKKAFRLRFASSPPLIARCRIALRDLPEEIYEVKQSEDQFVVRVGSTLASVEQELIRRTLDATNGNRSRAAEILGVPRRSLYLMLHRNGFQPRGKKSGRSGGDVSRT